MTIPELAQDRVAAKYFEVDILAIKAHKLLSYPN